MNLGLSKQKERGTSQATQITTGRATRQLELDEAAIQKIIEDVLSGPQGLASIFAGEQTAGIFDSSVTAQAAGDIVANLVGELAKLTGREVSTQDTTTEQTGRTTGKQSGFNFGIDATSGLNKLFGG